MGLPVVRTGNTALDRFLEQVREYIESSRGGGSPTAEQNRVLRVSDISSIVQLAAAGAAKLPKAYTQQEMEKFAADLSNTRLFQSLTGEGSALGSSLEGLPATNIMDVRAQRNANSAGVVSNAIVASDDTRSVAALVTTVEARLDNFDGAASIEEAYLALADATTGLEAQYTVKVTAGGAIAGFGLAATDPVGGTPSSAFIVSADKFAVVMPGYSGGLTNTPSGANVPFGVDAGGVYINGTVRINAGGVALDDALDGVTGPAGAPGAPGATGATGARGATRTVRTVSGLSAWSDAEANAAISALGFSPVVRDEVTLRDSDSAPAYLETRYWSGSAWASIGVTINGNLLVSGSITSDKIGTNTITAATINTTGAVKATSSLSVSGGATKASIVGYNSSAGGGEYGVYGHSSAASGVYGACSSSVGGVGVQGTGYYGGYFSSNNASGSAVYANNPFGGTALSLDGKLQWGSVAAYPAPTNTGTKYLRDDGTWSTPSGSSGVTTFNTRSGAVTLTSTDVASAVAGTGVTLAANITGNAGTVGGYSAGDFSTATTNAIASNNSEFVVPNFIQRSGASFTLTIPGVGTWSGCTVS